MEAPNADTGAEVISAKQAVEQAVKSIQNDPAIIAKPDAVEQAAKSVQNDPSIINAKTHRKNFMEALENGTLACLPGADGKADVSDVRNVVNSTKYRGMTTLLLKSFSKINGFPTNEYMTLQQLDKVNMEKNIPWNERLKVKKGSHGINIDFSVPKRDKNGNEVKDPETGKTVSEKVTAKLFNIAQVENPEKLAEWAKEQSQARYEHAKAKAGDKWHEPDPGKVREVVSATSSDPAQYLAEYFDAMERGKDFSASKEIVEAFKAKTEEYVWERKEGEEKKPHINPYRLNMLGYEASKRLNEMREARSKEIRNGYAKKSYEERQKNRQDTKHKSQSVSDDEGMSMSD